MSLIDILEAKCQSTTSKKLFGICDDPPPPPYKAYIDETDGAKWIAVVVNEDKHLVTFTAIDHCLDMKEDGKDLTRCDGVLTYNDSVIFVELKSAASKADSWIDHGVNQLEQTINHFKKHFEDYKIKKAYLANNKRPQFRRNRMELMDRFSLETGYVFLITNRIILQ